MASAAGGVSMGAKRTMRLSGRERQIMELLWARGQATAAEVREGIAEPPSYSAVRATLRILEGKGQVKHREEEGRYVYVPARPPAREGKSALRSLVQTFFGGRRDQALAALLEDPGSAPDPAELARLEALIRRARKAGR